MDFGSYVWPGALLATIGFVTLFGLLATEGALGRSRQLAATRDIAAGRSGTTKRVALGLAVFLLLCGLCGFFLGIGAVDGQQRNRCEETCVARGYLVGTVQGSKAMEGKKHAFLACVCTGALGTEPLELDAETLTER